LREFFHSEFHDAQLLAQPRSNFKSTPFDRLIVGIDIFF